MNDFAMETVKTILDQSELIGPSSEEYEFESQTWQAHRNLHPKILARPESLTTLSTLIAFLAGSNLDWTVRCQGIGDASAKDVLISLSGFKDFSFDQESETITIGAGMSWGEVEEKLEKQAFGYQVVKLDGSVIWASEEPDLLFALRGGGHEFAIVTAFRLKVYRFSQKIYSGSIVYPRSALPEVAKGVADFAKRMEEWPGTAMYVYNLDLMEGASIGAVAQPGIAIWLFDPEGEEHGRKIFNWAPEIEGAIDLTSVMSLKQVNIHGDSVLAAKGLCSANLSNITISNTDMTQDLILRAWEWLDDTIALEPTKLNTGTFVLLELFQKPVFRSAVGSNECAWPHTQNQHLLHLGVGRLNEGDYPTRLDVKALDMLKDAGKLVVGERFSPADYFINFLQPWNDRRAVYGENYEKLQALKKKYDPRGVLVRKNE